MGRNIVTSQSIATATAGGNPPPTQKPDNYASQIVKLIPVEIVGVYLGISNIIAGQKDLSDHNSIIIQLSVFFIILIITPFYLLRVAGITDTTHVVIATVSFVIWSISLGGPFELLLKGYLPAGISVKFIGGIVIMIYTLIVPMFFKVTPSGK